MKKYTIGALFTPNFDRILLIKKTKPAWQAGKYNLPGGSIEEGETAAECVAREFSEETNISLDIASWLYIGKIDNPENYYVEFFTSICYDPSALISNTDEKCEWIEVGKLPENVISNLRWLIPFAINIWKQGNADGLKHGLFTYSY